MSSFLRFSDQTVLIHLIMNLYRDLTMTSVKPAVFEQGRSENMQDSVIPDDTSLILHPNKPLYQTLDHISVCMY